jgi:hypothetical protein
MEWQPIETAPRDNTALLLWWPEWWHHAHPGYFKHFQWHSDKALVPFPSGSSPEPYEGPTHWMPLPDPPA